MTRLHGIVTTGPRYPANIRAFLPLRKEERTYRQEKICTGGGAGARTKVCGHCPTKGPGKRAGLDKDRKVKEKGTGEGKGKRQEGRREAKETEVDKTPRFSSNWGRRLRLE